MAAELIQIIYKEEQRKECYPFARIYKNDDLTIFFENELIKRFVLSTSADKIGVCSWKLRQKQKYNVGKSQEITDSLINSSYDVLSFTKNSKYHEMLNAADLWHSGFKSALKKMLDFVGIPMPSEVSKPIYQNHFMASTPIYRDYVNSYLIPCMDAIKKNEEVRSLCFADSNYTALAKKDAASAAYLQQQIGMPYYPLVPFLLERLFSIYVFNKNINVTWV